MLRVRYTTSLCADVIGQDRLQDCSAQPFAPEAGPSPPVSNTATQAALTNAVPGTAIELFLNSSAVHIQMFQMLPVLP